MSTSTERMRRLRERRAAGLVPVDGPAPLAEEDRLAPAVEETLKALELGGEGLAAAQVARQYARVIDRASDQAYALRWIGPLLLESLVALRATPMSRKGEVKPGERRPTQLDQLRSRRRPGA